MYASTWICTKTRELERPGSGGRSISSLSLGESSMMKKKGSSERSSSVEDLEI